jgi:hypothetical protein
MSSIEVKYRLDDGGSLLFFEGLATSAGLTGITGPKGLRGDIGTTGSTGPTGPTGYLSTAWASGAMSTLRISSTEQNTETESVKTLQLGAEIDFLDIYKNSTQFTLKKGYTYFINSYFIGLTNGDQYYSIDNITTNESWSSTVEYLDVNTPVHADVNFHYTPTVDSTFEITSTLTDATYAYIGLDNLVCSISVMVMGASGVSGDDPDLPAFPIGSTGSQGIQGPSGLSVLGRASYDTVYGYSTVH